MPDNAGHVYVVRGDIRRLACDAWALPADGAGNTEPAWLAWPPGASDAVPSPTPFAHWTRDAPRARPVAGWPANLPTAWKLHVELARGVPSSWLVEAALGFVEAAAAAIAEQGRRQSGPGTPLLAIPLGVPGIGAVEGEQARRAAGRLARELLPELRSVAVEQGVDVALVAHSNDSLAAAWAARDQVDAGQSALPEHIRRGLEPVHAALARGRLAVCVGPGPSRRSGLPSIATVLGALIDQAELSDAWRATLHDLPQPDRARHVAGLVGGRGALARRLADSQVRAHVGLETLLIAGLGTGLVIAEGPDDQLEQGFAARGRPAEAVLDGGGPRGVRSDTCRLVLRRGTTRRSRSLVESLQDPGRRLQRHRQAMAAIRSSLPADGHLLVVGHRPGPALVALLSDIAPLLTDGAGPHVTVLAEGNPGALAELWPAGQVRWLRLDDVGSTEEAPRVVDAKPAVDAAVDAAPGAAASSSATAAASSSASATEAAVLSVDAASDERCGRLLAQVLDHLGTRSGQGRDLLAPSRIGLLSDADRALAQGLDDMLARLPAKARDATLWPDLCAWLRAHGHPAE